MASLRNSIVVALALASAAFAVPLAVERRADAADMVVETVWITVESTTTVWVPPTQATQQPNVAAAAAVATPPPAAPVVQPIPSAAPAPSPSTTTTTAAAVAAASSNAPGAFAAQAQPSPPSFSSAAPVAPSSAAAAAPAAAPSSAPAAQPAAGSSSGSNAGGPCQGQGNACTGDITHYDGGLGACGWNVNTNSDMQIALPFALMGTQSNGNPYCGRSLSIKGTNGNIVQATVGDKCMGCNGQAIDLTDALFKAVAPSGDGRVAGIQWWFN